MVCFLGTLQMFQIQCKYIRLKKVLLLQFLRCKTKNWFRNLSCLSPNMYIFNVNIKKCQILIGMRSLMKLNFSETRVSMFPFFFLPSDKPINISRIIDEFFLKIKCMIFIYYLKVCLWHFIKSGKINLLFKSSTQDIDALTCSCEFYSVFVNMVTTDREVAIKDKDCSTWTTLLILMLNNRYFLYK